MTQIESPKRKMQKKNDYQRHKLFRKIKRRRKALAEAELLIAEKLLRKKLKLPKFGGGKEKVNLDNAHFDKEGNLVDNTTGVKYTPISDDVVITPNTKYFYDPYASAGNYFDGTWSKDLINMIPGIGDGMDAALVIDDASRGKYLSAGAGALMLALPNFIEKPLKYIGKRSLPLAFKYYNKINPKSLYSLLFRNLESNGNLMSVLDILREYSSSGHFRMPVKQEHIDRYSNISPLQLFMSRQTAAGRLFNPNIVYKNTPEYWNYMEMHHPLDDAISPGSFSFVGNSRKFNDPYDAVIDASLYKNSKDMQLAISHELAHSLLHTNNTDASDLALKAFGYTPISNEYFLSDPHIEFGARGSLLKNYLGIYGNVENPAKITWDDYKYAVNNYPYKFRDNDIWKMRDYTSDSDAAAQFIQDHSFDSGKDIHIKKSKRGTFTKAAKSHGMSVHGFANKVLKNPSKYSAAMRKKANFARNASKWNK